MWFDENVLDKEEGSNENRRDDLPPLLASDAFLREKPKDVRRLDSVLCRGVSVTAIDPGIDVGG